MVHIFYLQYSTKNNTLEMKIDNERRYGRCHRVETKKNYLKLTNSMQVMSCQLNWCLSPHYLVEQQISLIKDSRLIIIIIMFQLNISVQSRSYLFYCPENSNLEIN